MVASLKPLLAIHFLGLEKADAWWCPYYESWWRDACPCWSRPCWGWWWVVHVCCLLKVDDVDLSGMCSQTWWPTDVHQCDDDADPVCLWFAGRWGTVIERADVLGYALLFQMVMVAQDSSLIWVDEPSMLMSSWKSWSVLRMLCWMKETHWGKMCSPAEPGWLPRATCWSLWWNLLSYLSCKYLGCARWCSWWRCYLRMSASPSSGLLTLVM